MPPRSAKRLTANQHNARHENGLAQPGRKVEKSSSKEKAGNTYASGTDARSGAHSVAHNDHLASSTSWHNASNVNSSGGGLDSVDGDGPWAADANDLHSLSIRSDNQYSARDAVQTPPNGDVAEEVEPSHRQIDVNASRNPAVHQGTSTIRLVTSILKACPLADTIAILIILLQIPPTFLTIIHVLFATLTFVPPSGSAISALPSFSDLFQGFQGTPSLATIALADIVSLAIWLLLWEPAQTIAFDFAQAVIAISLGGGYTGKGGATQRAFMCLGVIIFSRAAREKGLRPGELQFMSSSPTAASLNASDTFEGDFYTNPARGFTSWLRSILTIHILAQDLVRVVRRWLSRREARFNGSRQKTVRDVAGNASSPTEAAPPTSTSTTLHGAIHVNDTQGTSSAALVMKDGKDKWSSGKRKRKQSTQVRSQQPFWAALASTKVIVLQELEQSQPVPEAIAAGAIDPDNLGNAVHRALEDRIWITHIGPNEVSFEISFSAPEERQELSGLIRPDDIRAVEFTAGLDSPQACYIRVNRARWASTRLGTLTADKAGEDVAWTAEIFGLAPSCNYECEVVRSFDDVVVCCASVTTMPVPTLITGRPLSPVYSKVGWASSDNIIIIIAVCSEPVSPALVHKSLRPSSPVSTLKESAAAAEGKVLEGKAILKRTRREHKTQTAGLRKEVNSLNARVASSGMGDDRYRQRAFQISQHIRQAEETLNTVQTRVIELGNAPQEETRQWQQAKERWEERRRQHAITRSHVVAEKAQIDRRLASLQAEANAVQQKRERLQTRLAKLVEQNERITDANIQGIQEKERRVDEQVARRKERETMEANYVEQVSSAHGTIKEIQHGSQQLWQQIHAIETSYREQQRQLQVQQQQQQQLQNLSVLSPPTTLAPSSSASLSSEVLPSIGRKHTHSASATANHGNNGLNNFVFPAFAAAQQAPIPSIPLGSYFREHIDNRVRSSSMISSASGFTDGFCEPAITSAPRLDTTIATASTFAMTSSVHDPLGSDRDRDRDFSGSGSGSGGSQRGDPASPAIGPPTRKRGKLQQTSSPNGVYGDFGVVGSGSSKRGSPVWTEP